MIKLFEHNQIAYDSAVSMLAETGKAAIIHPTGTGKSFIGFKLCEDNPDKTICWLSPSEYIFKTQIENLGATGATVPENIAFFTYAKLALMTDEELAEITPDYIILDEFHRAGAEIWGAGVQKLLAKHDGTPILGLSATNIRYLDNQRDMADELFDGNIASEMTLGEAIVRGILAAPKYVLSVYSYQQNLDQYKNRIGRAKSKAVRDKAEEYFEQLRRALEKADGLDVIFDKHMTDRTGKYIVFTANFEAMNECIGMASKWFGKVDQKPHIYKVYSDDPSASKSFKDFKEDNDTKHLRLLFCIDALNEGVHVEDVSGVILFRPTISPIIYKQQIGRALSASKKKEPVIFDIVNNFENLYSIGTIEEEMRAAVTYYNFFGDGHEIITDSFRVYDEVRDCKRLFDELEETLTASWELMYRHAKEFYEENGHLEVPKRYKTEEGYSLGRWLMTQRKVRAGEQFGNLSEERIAKLDAIGMHWESMRDVAWEKYFACAKEYCEEHGDLQVPATYVHPNGIKLGMWLSNLRVRRKSGNHSSYLTEEHIAALDSLGMVWDQYDFLWERNFAAAVEYYRLHGDLNIPSDCIVNGVKVGTWIRTIRDAVNGKNLTAAKPTDEQIQRLNAIGMVWENRNDRIRNRGIEESKRYFEKNGNLDVPMGYVTQDGYKLGIWLTRQREKKRNGKLTDNQVALLDSLGMIWKRRTNEWEECYAHAQAYYAEHGNLSIPADYVADGIWLSKWLNEQKQIYRGNRKGKQLTGEQIRLLEDIGVTWRTAGEDAWYRRYEVVKDYFEKHGDINIPSDHFLSDGKKAGTWIIVQRKYRKEGKLTKEQIDLLDAIGMVWEFDDSWEIGFEHANTYYLTHGNLNVMRSYVCDDGYGLGVWLANQKNCYLHPKKYRSLSSEQVKRLENIGVVWSRQNTAWDSAFEKAKAYFVEFGNLEVPLRYKSLDGFSLGDWVRSQIEKYRDGKLTKEQIQKLESVGMDWMFSYEREWERHFTYAQQYYSKYGNLNIPTSYTDETGFALGLWLWRVKTGKVSLSENPANGDQKKRLTEIGMIWRDDADDVSTNQSRTMRANAV